MSHYILICMVRASPGPFLDRELGPFSGPRMRSIFWHQNRVHFLGPDSCPFSEHRMRSIFWHQNRVHFVDPDPCPFSEPRSGSIFCSRFFDFGCSFLIFRLAFCGSACSISSAPQLRFQARTGDRKWASIWALDMCRRRADLGPKLFRMWE